MARPEIDKSLDKSTPSDRSDYTLANIVSLRLKGWSQAKIGEHFGVSRQAISHKLKGLWELLDRESAEAYRENKVQLLNAMEMEMLSLLGEKEKRKKATLGNVAYAFTQIHQARRLEAGESTQNLGLHALVEKYERGKSPTAGAEVEAGGEA